MIYFKIEIGRYKMIFTLDFLDKNSRRAKKCEEKIMVRIFILLYDKFNFEFFKIINDFDIFVKLQI